MKTRETYLDFIRGIAILLAMGWHFNGTLTGISAVDMLLMPGRVLGWAGVDLFFVLSGFLIGGLIFAEYQRTGRFRAGKFLIRRAFKIWPVLYVYLLLLLVSGRYSWETFLLQNVFHVQNYYTTPLKHLWSLAVEEHFYLIFAFGFLMFSKRESGNINAMVLVLPVIWIACLIFRSMAVYYSVDVEKIYFQTHYRIDALAFGMFLAYLKIFKQENFNQVASMKFLLLIIFASGILILIRFDGGPAYKLTVRHTIAYLTAGAFLLYCYRLRVFDRNNLIIKGVAWLGLYSYAMYVYQFVMIRIIEAIVKKFTLFNVTPGMDLIFKYIGAILLAVAVTKLIERPFLVLREKLFPAY
ncbi:acyltransferase [Methylomonas sp. EFPC1]|uniref:acyltransferase family protein n=1 Tax=Methylomonas sp. EFPC1 TaxID=2812647 RepID=UPI001966FB25|nr:acyltransferase [Methylomonas sp. EFPC1]QSB01061.1 acyltransferase [Methylomonas sp. EFPC1]